MRVVFVGRKSARAAIMINKVLEANVGDMPWNEDFQKAWRASKYLIKHMDILHEFEGDEGSS